MKWRRRVFAFSLVFGAGIVSFGPVLSHSLSRRISMQWNADAHVESSKLSLQNTSITLSGLSIDHPEFNLTGGQVYLKFNPERLWYRDCVVESLVAKDVRWSLLGTQDGSAAVSANLPEFTSQALSQMKAFNQKCLERKATFNKLADGLNNLVASAEREANQKNHRIEQIFQSLESEVEGLRNPESFENPLRSSRRSESIRAKAQELEKLLAEERLLVISTHQSLESSLKSLSKSSAETTLQDSQIRHIAPQLSQEIANSLLSNASNLLQPYARASLIATESLLASEPKPTNNLKQSETVDSFASSSFGVDVFFPDIRPRITKIIKGRIYGQSDFAGKQEPFELHMSTSTKSLFDNSGRVHIYWKNQNSGDVNPVCMTQSFVSSEEGKNGIDEVSIQIQREDEFGLSTLNTSHSAASVQSAVSAPIRTLSEIAGLEAIGLDCRSFIERNPHFVVQGTTTNSILTGAQEPIRWSFAESDLRILQNWIAEEINALTSNRNADMNNSMRQRIEQDSSLLKLRVQALDADVKARQEVWNRQIAAKMQTTKEWESQQIRVSRLP